MANGLANVVDEISVSASKLASYVCHEAASSSAPKPSKTFDNDRAQFLYGEIWLPLPKPIN